MFICILLGFITININFDDNKDSKDSQNQKKKLTSLKILSTDVAIVGGTGKFIGSNGTYQIHNINDKLFQTTLSLK